MLEYETWTVLTDSAIENFTLSFSVTTEYDGRATANPIFIITAVVIEAVLMVLICTSNGVVLAAFIQTHTLRTITNYYIVQMAVADFSVGLWMPFHILAFAKPELMDTIHLCALRYAGIILSFAASNTSLVAMTYDRLYSILWPLHYQSNMTLTRYLVSAIIVWILPIIMAITVMVWHNQWKEMPSRECEMLYILKLAYLRFITMPVFFILTVALVIMYIIIFHVARKQAKLDAIMCAPANGATQQNTTRSQFRKEMKTLKTGLIIFCVFYSCWLPLMVVVLMQISYTPFIESRIISNVRLLFTFFAILNSALNPFVYAFRLPLFKAYIIKLLPCLKTKVSPQSQNDPTSMQQPTGWV